MGIKAFIPHRSARFPFFATSPSRAFMSKSIAEVVPNTTNECQSLCRHFTCENLFDNTHHLRELKGGRGPYTRSYRFSIMNTNQYWFFCMFCWLLVVRKKVLLMRTQGVGMDLLCFEANEMFIFRVISVDGSRTVKAATTTSAQLKQTNFKSINFTFPSVPCGRLSHDPFNRSEMVN